MTTVLMYLPATQAVQEVDDADTDKFAATGWRRADRHDLVAVFHPALNEHKTVLRAEVSTWLNRGYQAEPTYLYHPELGSQVVPADRVPGLVQDGWFDTPAKFPGGAANPSPKQSAAGKAAARAKEA